MTYLLESFVKIFYAIRQDPSHSELATEIDKKAKWPEENGTFYLYLVFILLFWAVFGRYP